MNSRKVLLAGASLLAIATALTQSAQAWPGGANCPTTGTITAACLSPISLSGDLVIANDGITTHGAVTPPSGTAITNTISAGTLSNSGTIQVNASSAIGIYNKLGSIGTLSNSGLIQIGTGTKTNEIGIENSGSIGSLTNTGIIGVTGSPALGIDNLGSIGTLTNTGTISGTSGIVNSGNIDTLINSKTINATATIVSDGYGIDNSGTILTLINDSNGHIDASGMAVAGIHNTGSIGALSNIGIISVSGRNGSGIYNNSTIGTLSNSGSIGASASHAFGINNNLGGIGTLTNVGTIVVNGLTATAIYNSGGIGVLTNSGLIKAVGNSSSADAYGINNRGSIGALTNSGTIIVSASSNAYGIYDRGTIGALTNSGTIIVSASSNAYGIYNRGTIGALTNSGAIVVSASSDAHGIYNRGTIGALTNSGTIAINATKTALGIVNSGSIGTLTNTGSIGASVSGNSMTIVAAGIANSGTIDALINTIGGSIVATADHAIAYGIANFAGTITTLTNDGMITISAGRHATGIFNVANSTAHGALVGGSIGTLTNSGTIAVAAHTAAFAINNWGSIGGLTNSGLIKAIAGGSSAEAYGIVNGGTIGTLTNSGQIIAAASNTSGRAYGISNSGSIGALSNSGTISVSSGRSAIGIANIPKSTTPSAMFGGTIGTLTNSGTIKVTAPTGSGISNQGVITVLSNTGVIDVVATGGGDGAFAIGNTGTIISLVNSGTIIGECTPKASCTQGDGIQNSGTIGTLTNSGTIEGINYAIDNLFGTLDTISNSGVIDGNIRSGNPLTISGGSGTIQGTLEGGTITVPALTFSTGNISLQDNIVANSGSGTVTNTGATLSLPGVVNVSGNYSQTGGVLAVGSSGELLTSGTASLTGGTVRTDFSSTGNYLVGDLGQTLISATSGLTLNGATIASGLTGLSVTGGVVNGTDLHVSYLDDYVGGNLSNLTITGTMSGPYGVYVASTGRITNLVVNGTIDSSQDDIYDGGTIGNFVNNGQLGSPYGVYIAAGSTMSSLNNGGTIGGTLDAIYNAGVLGAITNSGVISGNIYSVSALTIAGGGSGGTLSGGIITAPGVTFTAGNLALGDAINTGSGTVSNTGATLSLSTTVAITGNYNQTAGSLALGSSGQLAVSGTAVMNGGTVQASLSSTGNYLAGQSGRVLVSAASGSSYSGLGVNVALTGLDVTADTTSTKNLALVYRSDYVGGSLASLTNSGTVGMTWGVYVASTGNLSALSNSGTISGTVDAIYNAGTLGPISNSGTINGNIASATALSISGGTTTGTLTGGTITAPGVSFTSGHVLLKDNIVAGGGTGTVTNSGAALELSGTQTITGKYSQTGGSLLIDVASASNYGSLTVSGGASVTNSAIDLSGSGLAYGEVFTVVNANATSSYTSDTVNAGSFFAMLSQSGNNLIVRLGLPLAAIGNSAGGDAAVMGGVLQPLEGVPSFGPALTALGNSTTAQQVVALQQSAPAQVGGGAELLQRAMLMTGQVDDAIQNRSQTGGHGWTLWGQAMGGVAKRGADGAVQPYDISSWGLAMGADTKLHNDLVIGAALSWGLGWNNGTGVLSKNSNKVSGYQFTAYGSWSQGAWLANGQMAVGFNTYDQHRVIDVTDQTALASYNGRNYETLLDGGYAIALNGFTLTPTASLKWLRLAAYGYSESGAGFFDLAVGHTLQDQVQSGLGVKLDTTIDTSIGVLVPQMKAVWLHDFVNGAIATDAVLSGSSFATTALRPGADGAALGAGLSLVEAGNSSVRLWYNGEFRGGYTAHTGEIQVRFAY
jgi:uncharacterized protein with beta-barrel porin domain